MSGVEGDKDASSAAPRARLTGGGSGEMRVIERVIKESDGAAHYPMLTRANYTDWALVMKVQLQAQGLWEVIDSGVGDHRDDRRALSAILRAVQPEMLRTLAVKPTAKAAWDTLKTMRMGAERVRHSKAQTLRREFENMKFKDGESIEDFALRLSSLMNDLELHGDTVEERKAVLKFLCSVPPRYTQMAMSIEALVDLDTLSIEEVSGRLLAVEERYAADGDTGSGGVGGRLLLTEEEWLARQKRVSHGEGSLGGTLLTALECSETNSEIHQRDNWLWMQLQEKFRKTYTDGIQ